MIELQQLNRAMESRWRIFSAVVLITSLGLNRITAINFVAVANMYKMMCERIRNTNKL